jgi:cephalosporin hydroxylase
MNPHEAFRKEVENNIRNLAADSELKSLSLRWIEQGAKHKWTYNFSWLGRPIIQFPTDMVALQEIIWNVKPDVIIETGIAHGGSLIFSASMLALLDLCDGKGAESATARRVLAVDIEIRPHNRAAIEAHPLADRISMFEGSSTDTDIVATIRRKAGSFERVLVCLDSNHTHDHVLAELNAYAPLVTKGSYCVVFDTIIEDMPDSLFTNRPWDSSSNPKTAVHAFLNNHPEFVVDDSIDQKLQISVAPSGYLKRIA